MMASCRIDLAPVGPSTWLLYGDLVELLAAPAVEVNPTTGSPLCP